MKRFFDMTIAFVGLLLMSPILVPILLVVWLSDFHSPFYISSRVGLNGLNFKMVKVRSMIINADKSGVDSTSASDIRITPVGRFIRKFKIDEISQLWNVLTGDMSLVGPRPNVERDVELYTDEEKKLLSVRPGITDLSSIVFADEGKILEGHADPDLSYNQLIRPWKSRLGLLYIERSSLLLDLILILITVAAIFSRKLALVWVHRCLVSLDADQELVQVALRERELSPYPPPGSLEVVQSR